MAVAAMEILGITDQIAEVLDVSVAVPMVGQGSVAVECRGSDAVTQTLLAAIDHSESRRAVEAERAFLSELGAGCSLPVAAHLSSDGVFRAFMASDDMNDAVQIEGFIGDSDDHRLVGVAMAQQCRTMLSSKG